jgi:hypothetical protein
LGQAQTAKKISAYGRKPGNLGTQSIHQCWPKWFTLNVGNPAEYVAGQERCISPPGIVRPGNGQQPSSSRQISKYSVTDQFIIATPAGNDIPRPVE